MTCENPSPKVSHDQCLDMINSRQLEHMRHVNLKHWKWIVFPCHAPRCMFDHCNAGLRPWKQKLARAKLHNFPSQRRKFPHGLRVRPHPYVEKVMDLVKVARNPENTNLGKSHFSITLNYGICTGNYGISTGFLRVAENQVFAIYGICMGRSWDFMARIWAFMGRIWDFLISEQIKTKKIDCL